MIIHTRYRYYTRTTTRKQKATKRLSYGSKNEKRATAAVRTYTAQLTNQQHIRHYSYHAWRTLLCTSTKRLLMGSRAVPSMNVPVCAKGQPTHSGITPRIIPPPATPKHCLLSGNSGKKIGDANKSSGLYPGNGHRRIGASYTLRVRGTTQHVALTAQAQHDPARFGRTPTPLLRGTTVIGPVGLR